jgi:hypothetical protein
MGDEVAQPNCGSAGCIGGHACLLWPEVRVLWDDDDGTQYAFTWDEDKLAEKLGLSDEQCDHMCFMLRSVHDFDRVSRDDAVAYLDKLLETPDEVVLNWDDVLGEAVDSA